MENNENFVTEPVAENVEQTTEQTPKTYTQEEVDDIVGKRIARKEAKIRKEYDRKYGNLTDVLMAGTGTKTVEEATDTLEKFYTSKGVKLPQKPTYSDKDLEVLARAEADEIIRSGFEEVVEETDRLAALGAANMTAREKALFRTLAEHRQNAERSKELAKLGVTEDVYNSKEFQEFREMFKPETPIAKVYEAYAKTQPKKEYKTMGSMKSNAPQDNGLKEYYSFEEAKKFTKADFDKNPELFKRVQASMPQWYKK